ncbi:hypothetical protein LCGC14_2039150, partial [marine sediment metagenome]
EKESSKFSKCLQRKDGLQDQCKECRQEYQRNYRQTKQGKEANQRYGKTNKGREALKRHEQKQHQPYPEKLKAHYILNNAIRGGEIARPFICESCFNERFTDGHHEDYSKPLDVEWLCKKCHTELHRKVLV